MTPSEPARVPGQGFKPLNQQSFAARFLSPHTPYDKFIAFHAVGSGKSCLASYVSETAQSINSNLEETLILVRNDNLSETLRMNLRYNSDDKYKPAERYADPTQDQ